MLPGTFVLLAGLMFDGRELKPLLADPRSSSDIDPLMAKETADRANRVVGSLPRIQLPEFSRRSTLENYELDSVITGVEMPVKEQRELVELRKQGQYNWHPDQTGSDPKDGKASGADSNRPSSVEEFTARVKAWMEAAARRRTQIAELERKAMLGPATEADISALGKLKAEEKENSEKMIERYNRLRSLKTVQLKKP